MAGRSGAGWFCLLSGLEYNSAYFYVKIGAKMMVYFENRILDKAYQLTSINTLF